MAGAQRAEKPVQPERTQAPRRVLESCLKAFSCVYLLAIIAAIIVYKALFIKLVVGDPFFAVYGLCVAAYILSRFLFSLFYRAGADHGIEPRVAIVMPGFNEEGAIARSLRSLLELDYPADKLEIVAVNDGSSDRTLLEMCSVEREANGRMRVISFPQNRGKRAAMAAGMRATDAEIIAFVDSDSMLEPDALRILVQHFADQRVGAVAGHAEVLNIQDSWMSRMQAVRYFVAFKVLKAAESVFGAVTCCSGCFAAYRRAAILPHLEKWEHQRFLGRPATFGDDRSLTNFVLRDWKVPYEAKAVSHTIVPSTLRKFLLQQVRWKRSWTRESLIAARFIWRKHPVAAMSVYVGTLLPLAAPIAAGRALLWRPIVDQAGSPLMYLVGVYAMATIYGLYYAMRQNRWDALWLFGILFVFFYLCFLVWQTYYAILTSNRTSWGTRPSRHIRIAEGPV
jgi:hyaluronan synthase